MKTAKTPVYQSFKSVLNSSVGITDEARNSLLIRMRENIATQKTLIAQITFEVDCLNMPHFTDAIGPVLDGAKEQMKECIKVQKQILALFN